MTLDPIAAQQDRTLESLPKMLNKELRQTKNDKATLKKEQVAAFEGTHKDDIEFLERKNRAGCMYDYYHNKLYESDNKESDFDINYLSDFSDEGTMTNNSNANPAPTTSDKEISQDLPNDGMLDTSPPNELGKATLGMQDVKSSPGQTETTPPLLSQELPPLSLSPGIPMKKMKMPRCSQKRPNSNGKRRQSEQNHHPGMHQTPAQPPKWNGNLLVPLETVQETCSRKPFLSPPSIAFLP